MSLLKHAGMIVDLEDRLHRKVDMVTEGNLLPFAVESAPLAIYLKMRHVLVHGCYQVAVDEIWAAIEDDLPLLKNQIEGYPRTL